MKTKANKYSTKRIIPFDEVIRLYLKNKPITEMTKKINLLGLHRFCKINQLSFTEEIFLRWLRDFKMVSDMKIFTSQLKNVKEEVESKYGYTRCQKAEGKIK